VVSSKTEVQNSSGFFIWLTYRRCLIWNTERKGVMGSEWFRLCRNVEYLKKGGQKEVFKAVHPSLGSVVIKKGKFSTVEGLERIRREVGFYSKISSKYFPKNYGFDFSANDFYILEEYVPSDPLSNCMDRFRSEEEIASLAIEIIKGLSLLWNKKIVHRDLKPDNILILPNGDPVIIDLGIARFLEDESLTNTWQHIGPCTPIYASPEQLRNEKNKIDHRSDLFSLGIIMLELHLAYHPYDPNRIGKGIGIVQNIVSGRHAVPSKSSQVFRDTTSKLLMVKPYQRFRNSELVLLNLQKIQEQ